MTKFIILIFISFFLSSPHTQTQTFTQSLHKILNDPKAWNLWIVHPCKKKEKVDVWKRRLKFAWPAHLSIVTWLFDLTSQIRFQEIDSNFVYNFPTNFSSIANPHDKLLDHFTMCYILSHFTCILLCFFFPSKFSRFLSFPHSTWHRASVTYTHIHTHTTHHKRSHSLSSTDLP